MGQSGALRLYRATRFPLTWEFDRVLYQRPLVDASIVKYQGQFWMFASDQVRTTIHARRVPHTKHMQPGQDGAAVWPAGGVLRPHAAGPLEAPRSQPDPQRESLVWGSPWGPSHCAPTGTLPLCTRLPGRVRQGTAHIPSGRPECHALCAGRGIGV